MENGVVRLRLTPAQIDMLAPGIQMLVHSHQVRQRSGRSPLAYPFHILPPPRGFHRGDYIVNSG